LGLRRGLPANLLNHLAYFNNFQESLLYNIGLGYGYVYKFLVILSVIGLLAASRSLLIFNVDEWTWNEAIAELTMRFIKLINLLD